MRCFISIEIPEHVKILYGPSFFVFPDNSWLDGAKNEIWSKRCLFTCLSEWTLNLYKDFIKESVIPMKAIPFGVNDKISNEN